MLKNNLNKVWPLVFVVKPNLTSKIAETKVLDLSWGLQEISQFQDFSYAIISIRSTFYS